MLLWLYQSGVRRHRHPRRLVVQAGDVFSSVSQNHEYDLNQEFEIFAIPAEQRIHIGVRDRPSMEKRVTNIIASEVRMETPVPAKKNSTWNSSIFMTMRDYTK
jgi:hypothetical protein